jgi:hypothetical protein
MESNFLKIVLGIAAGFLLCLHTIEPKAQALYGAQGQYLGNIQQSGNTANYYGPQGQYQGSAQTSGNQTNFYGANGAYQGTYQNQVQPSYTPYTPYIPQQPLQPQMPRGY